MVALFRPPPAAARAGLDTFAEEPPPPPVDPLGGSAPKLLLELEAKPVLPLAAEFALAFGTARRTIPLANLALAAGWGLDAR